MINLSLVKVSVNHFQEPLFAIPISKMRKICMETNFHVKVGNVVNQFFNIATLTACENMLLAPRIGRTGNYPITLPVKSEELL